MRRPVMTAALSSVDMQLERSASSPSIYVYLMEYRRWCIRAAQCISHQSGASVL